MSVYRSPLIDAATAIRALCPICGYNPAPFHPPGGPADPAHVEHAALFARGYAAVKYAVAAILKPRSIVEVGVGTAVAARAFLDACPRSRYTGFDIGCMRPGILDEARAVLAGFDATIVEADSQSLTALPLCDLAHVDGDHSYAACLHDVTIALFAAEWVLVDDARDSHVAAAALAAASKFRPGDLEWDVFSDTWTGSILIHTQRNSRRPA